MKKVGSITKDHVPTKSALFLNFFPVKPSPRPVKMSTMAWQEL